jgi:hypothetical protein
MRQVFLWVWVLIVLGCSHKKALQTKEQPIFPTDWIGNWSGPLDIYNQGKWIQTLPMSINIKHIDANRFQFMLWYGQDSTGIRPYELVAVDTSKGQFLNDEKNGIRMEAYLMGNQMSCMFDVMGNRLVSNYRLENGQLVSDIIVAKIEPISQTGDTILQTTNNVFDTIPVVKTYPIKSRQIAYLTRKSTL